MKESNVSKIKNILRAIGQLMLITPIIVCLIFIIIMIISDINFNGTELICLGYVLVAFLLIMIGGFK